MNRVAFMAAIAGVAMAKPRGGEATPPLQNERLTQARARIQQARGSGGVWDEPMLDDAFDLAVSVLSDATIAGDRRLEAEARKVLAGCDRIWRAIDKRERRRARRRAVAS
jgi:hypothetical protein